MKRNILLIVLGFACFLPLQSFSDEPPQTDESKKIEDLVDKAAALVESKGKDAFPELRKEDGDWWKGELYVFVDGLDGTVLVHPIEPKIEGQNLLKDPASKKVMTLLIDKVKAEGSGWVEYMWPKPGETKPSKKMSYIKKVKMPDEAIVIVGAGMYVSEQP